MSQARAVSSGLLGTRKLLVVPQSASDTAAAAAALADVGYAFAPRVQSESSRLFLEVGELEQLFPQGERAIAQAIAAQAARVGLLVQVGIASSAAVARVAAQAADIALVPAGREPARAFLAPLPVETALQAGVPGRAGRGGGEIGARLQRWGIKTLGGGGGLAGGRGDGAPGPGGGLAARAGLRPRRGALRPRLPPDALEEGTDLDYPIYEIEPLAFVLRGLLDRALARLSCRGLACAGLGLRLKLDPRGFDVREIPLAAPSREPATLLQLVRLDLARRPPPAAVVGLRALVLPARVRASQLDLWRPAGPAPEQLAATLARLGALVGPENVGAPALVDTLPRGGGRPAALRARAAPGTTRWPSRASRCWASGASARPGRSRCSWIETARPPCEASTSSRACWSPPGPIGRAASGGARRSSRATTGTSTPRTAPSTACTRSAAAAAGSSTATTTEGT